MSRDMAPGMSRDITSCPRGEPNERVRSDRTEAVLRDLIEVGNVAASVDGYSRAASIVRLAHPTNRSARFTASEASLALACLDSYSTTFFFASSILTCLTLLATSLEVPPTSWRRSAARRWSGSAERRPARATHTASVALIAA
jgi:hypothetical protein